MDHLLISGSTDEKINEFEERRKIMFEMSILGLLSSYLGVQVRQIKGEILLSQRFVCFENLLKQQHS